MGGTGSSTGWMNSLGPTGMMEGVGGMLTGSAYEQKPQSPNVKRPGTAPQGPSALKFMASPSPGGPGATPSAGMMQPGGSGGQMSLQELLAAMRARQGGMA